MSTVAELSFENKDIEERWSRVRTDFWGDLQAQTQTALKHLLERTMEIEIQDLVGCGKWKREPRRRTYRNGHYTRDLLTSMGSLTKLRVPRVRSGGLESRLLPRYRRRTAQIDELIMKMFLSGVSTRKVEEVLRPLMGERALSASTVSEITQQLDSEVNLYHQRPIKDDYVYLIVDGIYLKAKSPVVSRRRCILAVYGITRQGMRELIDYRVGRKGESQEAWEGLFTSLRNRGLEGRHLRLVVVDGNPGAWNALNLVWPDVRRQRCWAHKLRNVANYLPKRLQKPCTGQARGIYNAKDYAQAIRAYKRWVEVWKPVSQKAVHCLALDLEDMLQVFQEPEGLRIKVRTTNIIERLFREVRRRTRPMSCFTNLGSVDRIIYAIFARQNNLWRQKPLKQFTQNS
jgi:putative transposase